MFIVCRFVAARTTTVKNGFDTKMSQGSIQSANCRNGLWQVQEMTGTSLLWPPNAMKNLIL